MVVILMKGLKMMHLFKYDIQKNEGRNILKLLHIFLLYYLSTSNLVPSTLCRFLFFTNLKSMQLLHTLL